MDDLIPSPETAARHHQQALELKSQGLHDAALTEFRRAALADPNRADTQMAIGQICRDKARTEPMYLRYAFDAFRKAARLAPAETNHHDQYIMAAQKMGLLDELQQEYSNLSKKDPSNELYQRCLRNIMTISMATVMPDRVQMGGGASSLRKVVFVTALGTGLLALALIVLPAVLNKSRKEPMAPEKLKSLMRLGLFCGAVSVGGFIGYSRIKN